MYQQPYNYQQPAWQQPNTYGQQHQQQQQQQQQQQYGSQTTPYGQQTAQYGQHAAHFNQEMPQPQINTMNYGQQAFGQAQNQAHQEYNQAANPPQAVAQQGYSQSGATYDQQDQTFEQSQQQQQLSGQTDHIHSAWSQQQDNQYNAWPQQVPNSTPQNNQMHQNAQWNQSNNQCNQPMQQQSSQQLNTQDGNNVSWNQQMPASHNQQTPNQFNHPSQHFPNNQYNQTSQVPQQGGQFNQVNETVQEERHFDQSSQIPQQGDQFNQGSQTSHFNEPQPLMSKSIAPFYEGIQEQPTQRNGQSSSMNNEKNSLRQTTQQQSWSDQNSQKQANWQNQSSDPHEHENFENKQWIRSPINQSNVQNNQKPADQHAPPLPSKPPLPLEPPPPREPPSKPQKCYQAPPLQKNYQPPPPQKGYQPSPQKGYQPPPQQNYQPPPPQKSREPPPPQKSYQPPPLQNSYQPPPPQKSYQPPPPQKSYQPSPPQKNYQPPPSQKSYQPPPPQKSYQPPPPAPQQPAQGTAPPQPKMPSRSVPKPPAPSTDNAKPNSKISTPETATDTAVVGETLVSLQEQLLTLEKQIRTYQTEYQKWHQDFVKWQKQHQNHPDQKQYIDYQKKYQKMIEEQQTQLKQQYAELQKKITNRKSQQKSAGAAKIAALNLGIHQIAADATSTEAKVEISKQDIENLKSLAAHTQQLKVLQDLGEIKKSENYSKSPLQKYSKQPYVKQTIQSASQQPDKPANITSAPQVEQPPPPASLSYQTSALHHHTPTQVPSEKSPYGIMVRSTNEFVGVRCRFFPKCKHGNKCKFEHPMCASVRHCADPECPYEHPPDRDMTAVKNNEGQSAGLVLMKPGPAEKPKGQPAGPPFVMGEVINSIGSHNSMTIKKDYPKPVAGKPLQVQYGRKTVNSKDTGVQNIADKQNPRKRELSYLLSELSQESSSLAVPPKTARTEQLPGRLEQPTGRLEQPGRPEWPVGTPEQSMGRPEQSIGRPEQSMDRPEQSMGRPEQSMSRAEQPVGRPKQPMDRPEQPMDRPEQPMGKSEQPIGRLEQPASNEAQPLMANNEPQSLMTSNEPQPLMSGILGPLASQVREPHSMELQSRINEIYEKRKLEIMGGVKPVDLELEYERRKREILGPTTDHAIDEYERRKREVLGDPFLDRELLRQPPPLGTYERDRYIPLPQSPGRRGELLGRDPYYPNSPLRDGPHRETDQYYDRDGRMRELEMRPHDRDEYGRTREIVPYAPPHRLVYDHPADHDFKTFDYGHGHGEDRDHYRPDPTLNIREPFDRAPPAERYLEPLDRPRDYYEQRDPFNERREAIDRPIDIYDERRDHLDRFRDLPAKDLLFNQPRESPIHPVIDHLDRPRDPLDRSRDSLERPRDPLDRPRDPLDRPRDPLDRAEDLSDRSRGLMDRPRDPLDKPRSQDRSRDSLDRSRDSQRGRDSGDRRDRHGRGRHEREPPSEYLRRIEERERERNDRDSMRDYEMLYEKDLDKPSSNDSRIPESELKPEVFSAEDILDEPGRKKRPKHIVIILRGIPGAGKSFVAKLIRDKESQYGAQPPRILALDDYFMQEVEKTENVTGKSKPVVTKQQEYVFEKDMEEAYRTSLLKAFNKTLNDGFFPLVIVDAINDKTKHFDQFWSDAKHKGFEVYIAEVTGETNICMERSVHKRPCNEVEEMVRKWEKPPVYYKRLDVSAFLQDAAIADVEMEEAADSSDKNDDKMEDEKKEEEEDEELPSLFHIPKSKWESSKEETLAKLDGIAKRKCKGRKSASPIFPEDDEEDDPYGEKEADIRLGKKRVRWADIEQKKQIDHQRKIGFSIGMDWNILTDPYAQIPK